jgi:hypothetical protein
MNYDKLALIAANFTLLCDLAILLIMIADRLPNIKTRYYYLMIALWHIPAWWAFWHIGSHWSLPTFAIPVRIVQ